MIMLLIIFFYRFVNVRVIVFNVFVLLFVFSVFLVSVVEDKFFFDMLV